MSFRIFRLVAILWQARPAAGIEQLMKRAMQSATQSKLAAMLSLLLLPAALTGQQNPPATTPSTEVIIAKLTAANQHRAQLLRGFQGRRLYRLDYHGFLGSHKAELQAEITYTAPDKKEFKVISQSGAKVLINRVLLKLLESEKEAAQQQNRKQMELNPKNYDFKYLDTQSTANGPAYVLAVHPHEKTKFLYSGKIWVDATDYAVTRMEGEPAKNPSVWISGTRIVYTWSKIGSFWLPSHNQSVTQVRMGGSAVLTIDYTDYQISGLSRTASVRGGDKSVLPDPSLVTPDQH